MTEQAETPNAGSPEAAPEPLSSRALCLAALGGGLLLWASLPPLGWSVLAFLAPLPWLWLIAQPHPFGRGTYGVVWLAMAIHWLAVLEGIRHAHPAVSLGWVALSLYLATFFTLFFWLTREAVHRCRWPLWLAAPLVWVACEYLRGFGPFAFSACLLGHTQLHQPELIQISDLFGGYGVSFVVMLVAAAVFDFFWRLDTKGAWFGIPPAGMSPVPLVVMVVVMTATIAYGQMRLAQLDEIREAAPEPARIALLQGTQDTAFDGDPARDYNTFEEYYGLAKQAIAENAELDLIVWPETCFPIGAEKWEPPTGSAKYSSGYPWFVVEEGTIEAPPDAPSDYPQRLEFVNQRLMTWTREKLRELGADRSKKRRSYVVGVGVVAYGPHPPARYNSALLFDHRGSLRRRYDKTCPVAFGEYIPLGDFFPWLYSVTPIGGGLSIGNGPQVFPVGPCSVSPSICFESTLPSLIRSQVSELQQKGERPEALLNITNDGWFWGSSILDIHLACSAFRAVENRLPMLIAANTGISAHIDAAGRIQSQLPRRTAGVLVAEIRAARLDSFYTTNGDLFAALCLSSAIWIFGAILRGWRAADEGNSARALQERFN